MKKYLPLSVFAVLIYAGQSLGAGISYNYIELGYLESELKVGGLDVDGDGYEFNASLDVAQSLAVVIGYQDIEFDRGVDASLQSLGIAYHKPYSATGDMILGLAYLDSEIESRFVSIDESGNEFSLEIRNKSSAQTEFHIGLVRREIDGDANSGYLFRIISGNPAGFQFVIDYEDLDDTDGLTLGLRSSF